jgi:hypothetical protein
MSGNDGFLSRWSRRKQSAAIEPDDPDAVPEDAAADGAGDAEEAALADTEADEELSDAEILEKYDLRDPDELGPGDDFSGFMRAAIPEHLRRRALRTLWRSNPVLANLDGLNDYDGDWTGGSVPAGQLKTAYRVGMGFVRDVAEASGKLDDVAGELESSVDSAGNDGEHELDEEPLPMPEVADAENVAGDDGETDENVENPRLSARKRMMFRVGEG